MPTFSFADAYKLAGLDPNAELIGRREKAFAKLRKSLSPRSLCDLSRLYFDLPTSGVEWFRTEFAAEDASFTLVDNARESAVLALCLLSAALADGEVLGGLAPLVASAAGVRKPVLRPEFLTDARSELHKRAVELRRQSLAGERKSRKAPKIDLSAQITAFVQAPDWPKVGDLVQKAADKTAQALVTDSQNETEELRGEINSAREELEMLWWYVGGWSQVLSRPFTDLSPDLAAVMIGLDLGRLVSVPPGPAAAPAILERLIGARTNQKVSIKAAVDGFPESELRLLAMGNGVVEVRDLCPIHAALARRVDVGNEWSANFGNTSHFDPSLELRPLDVAMQTYREALVIAQINDD